MTKAARLRAGRTEDACPRAHAENACPPAHAEDGARGRCLSPAHADADRGTMDKDRPPCGRADAGKPPLCAGRPERRARDQGCRRRPLPSGQAGGQAASARDAGLAGFGAQLFEAVRPEDGIGGARDAGFAQGRASRYTRPGARKKTARNATVPRGRKSAGKPFPPGARRVQGRFSKTDRRPELPPCRKQRVLDKRSGWWQMTHVDCRHFMNNGTPLPRRSHTYRRKP